MGETDIDLMLICNSKNNNLNLIYLFSTNNYLLSSFTQLNMSNGVDPDVFVTPWAWPNAAAELSYY